MVKLLYTLAFLTLTVWFSSCENLIEYSSFQVNTSATGRDKNRQAIEVITSSSADEFKPFKIALIGDSHTFYDDFKDQVKALNLLDSIDFMWFIWATLHISGIYREFIWYGEIIEKLQISP
jgi:3',5'-cyclic-AMP phosphodiesterase